MAKGTIGNDQLKYTLRIKFASVRKQKKGVSLVRLTPCIYYGDPYGTRTRVAGVRGRF